MSEEAEQNIKEYWKKKYNAAVTPLKKISMKRNCLKCDKLFVAHGVPNGVRYIRLCLTCKHFDARAEECANRAGYTASED